MSAPQVRLEQQGQLATLTLARPSARNAMTPQMGAEVALAVDTLNRSAVRAVVVRGEGECFCAGGDFSFLEARIASTPEQNREAMLGFYEAFLSIRRLKAPTIAAVHGAAVGAGLCFALACDLRIAAAGTRLALNFVKLGLHPGMGASWTLPRLVGPGRAAELILTGRQLDAAQALAIGLINELVPLEQLVPRAREVALEISHASPLAVQQAKQSMLAFSERDLTAALHAEAAAQAIDYRSEDLKEGVRAAKERRAPNFRGS